MDAADQTLYQRLLRLQRIVNAAISSVEYGQIVHDENASRFLPQPLPRFGGQENLFRLGDFIIEDRSDIL